MTTNATTVFWIAQALAGGLLCMCIYRTCTLAWFGGEEAGGAELTRGERAVIATFYGMTVAGAVNGAGGGAGLLLLGAPHGLASTPLVGVLWSFIRAAMQCFAVAAAAALSASPLVTGMAAAPRPPRRGGRRG